MFVMQGEKLPSCLLAVAAAMSVDLAASFCDFDYLSSGRSLGVNALRSLLAVYQKVAATSKPT